MTFILHVFQLRASGTIQIHSFFLNFVEENEKAIDELVSSLSPSERQQLAEGFLENSGYDEPSNESELPRLFYHSIFYNMYMYQLIIKTGRRSTEHIKSH